MSGPSKGIHNRSCRLRDQIWKASTLILAVTVSLLSYRLASQRAQPGIAQPPHISVEWLPTGKYFLALEEPWVHAGPSTDLQTLHVRHSVQPAIVILMIDSRPCDLDSYGAASAQFPPDMAAVTPSLALHYALLHGYDYVRSRIPRDTERTAAWYDVPLLRTLLLDHKYSYVFKMDADSYFHQIERRIESVVRQHALDREKVVWMPRDIQFGGFEFPDSNINAGVLLFARKPETQEMLDDWWRCPFDGTGEPGWTHNWPAEQGCLWVALVNSTKWAHACAPDWDSEFVGKRPSWVHHLTSGSSSGADRNAQGAAEVIRYFLHAMRQSLLPAQARLSYSRYGVDPR